MAYTYSGYWQRKRKWIGHVLDDLADGKDYASLQTTKEEEMRLQGTELGLYYYKKCQINLEDLNHTTT